MDSYKGYIFFHRIICHILQALEYLLPKEYSQPVVDFARVI